MAALPRVLPNELVEEILLLRPPDEPDYLLRASLVCKTWSDIVFHSAFCHRLHELHGEPPVPGFLHNWNDEVIPTTTSSFSLAAPHRQFWRALECRHGHALFISDPEASRGGGGRGEQGAAASEASGGGGGRGERGLRPDPGSLLEATRGESQIPTAGQPSSPRPLTTVEGHYRAKPGQGWLAPGPLLSTAPCSIAIARCSGGDDAWRRGAARARRRHGAVAAGLL
ncbi:hypothetical protein D1007_46714 [Hordeum vulgare]|nr:hypothetical protein D1007_46714 [Hordeum vulgare]